MVELIWHDTMTQSAAVDGEAYLPYYQRSRLKGRLPNRLLWATLRPHDCFGL